MLSLLGAGTHTCISIYVHWLVMGVTQIVYNHITCTFSLHTMPSIAHSWKINCCGISYDFQIPLAVENGGQFQAGQTPTWGSYELQRQVSNLHPIQAIVKIAIIMQHHMSLNPMCTTPISRSTMRTTCEMRLLSTKIATMILHSIGSQCLCLCGERCTQTNDELLLY